MALCSAQCVFVRVHLLKLCSGPPEKPCSTSVRPSPLPLTLIQVILLHGADEVRSGIKVMWPRLLQAPQAEETSFICGAAGKGPPAWDAGVTCPAFHLQVKSLQCCHRHLPLTTTWRRQENQKHIYSDIKALHVHRAYLFVKVYWEYIIIT